MDKLRVMVCADVGVLWVGVVVSGVRDTWVGVEREMGRERCLSRGRWEGVDKLWAVACSNGGVLWVGDDLSEGRGMEGVCVGIRSVMLEGLLVCAVGIFVTVLGEWRALTAGGPFTGVLVVEV